MYKVFFAIPRRRNLHCKFRLINGRRELTFLYFRSRFYD